MKTQSGKLRRIFDFKAKNYNLKLKTFTLCTAVLTFTLLLFSLHVAPSAHAQPVGPIGPVGPTQGVPINTVFRTPFQNFGTLVSVIISNLYIIAGIVILFLIIFGGFGIISGAGSGDQQKTAQGKQALTSAVIGFLIIFTSYWIIQLIELVTGLNILNPGF